MQIRRVTLREIHMDLVTPFETSFERTTQRRILLVEAGVDGVAGWGECVAGETPYYAPETVETAVHILRDFLWPAIQGREFQSAADVWNLLARVRGHSMAKGGLEAAVWDAEARMKNVPLWKLIGGTLQEIPCGVSIGIKASLDELVAQIQKELAAGYQRIKIKIKPGWDVRAVARVRESFPRIRLMVDANCAYGRGDFPLLQQLEAYYLMMIEQPLGWDDLYSHVELQKLLQTPICLDECIHTEEQARAALELGACRIVNIKLGRVGGYTVARRIHDLCQKRGVPVWCGGMLESGIGRAHNIALSTLPNFSLPGDVSASRRYWTQDIVEPEVSVTPQGTIRVPEGPGMGFAPRLDLIEQRTANKIVLT
ncbi:MAG TPA: o-succinylbenzoate synthase [Candidatus Acidoferrales bacterium]|nr:o-succinylbenzoate synthase [Candidatus Acidoferrales bacterium]